MEVMRAYWKTRARSMDGWFSNWAKTVVDFKEQKHCYDCLVGRRLKAYGMTNGQVMPINTPVTLELPEGHHVVYFCAVSKSMTMEYNLHLPVRYRSGSIATKMAYTGDELIVLNAEEIEFDDDAAKYLFPEASHHHLRCRNFQFAAQEFQEKYLDRKAAR